MRTHHRHLALVACAATAVALVPAAAAAAATKGTTPSGSATAAHRPHFVAGDFDGDGKPDITAGAPGGNRVRVHYTHIHPGGSHNVWLYPHVSSVYSMGFGTALAVGDFNHDGRSDLAVGAPYYATPADPTVGDGALETRGAVFVFLGSPTGLQEQPLTIVGPYDGDDPFALGASLAVADTNGDGYSDLAADLLGGAGDGDIHVYYGYSGGLNASGYTPLHDFEATSLAFGDVNGDHHPDLVAGSTVDESNPVDYDYGDVMVFRGTSAGISAASPRIVQGSDLGVSDLGTAVAVGDVTGDGYADVVAGAADSYPAPTHVTGGSIVVLRGGPHGVSAARSQVVHERAVDAHARTGDWFGGALSINKIRGASRPDVVVGAPYTPVAGVVNAGAVWVLKGSSSGVSTSGAQRFTQATAGVPGSPSTNASFGSAIWTSSITGDGHLDAAIGVPNADDPATGGGMVVVLRGSAGGLSVSHASSFGDGQANDALGTSIR